MQVTDARKMNAAEIAALMKKKAFDEVELSPRIQAGTDAMFGRHMTAAQVVEQIVADMRLSDVDVKLDTSGCNAYDLSKMELLFKRGYRQTSEMLESQGYSRVYAPEMIMFKQKDENKTDYLRTLNPLKEALSKIYR